MRAPRRGGRHLPPMYVQQGRIDIQHAMNEAYLLLVHYYDYSDGLTVHSGSPT